MMIAVMFNDNNAKIKNYPLTYTIAQIQKTTWQDVPESGLRYQYHTVTYLLFVNYGTSLHYLGL